MGSRCGEDSSHGLLKNFLPDAQYEELIKLTSLSPLFLAPSLLTPQRIYFPFLILAKDFVNCVGCFDG